MKKVYAAMVNTYYECGDISDHSETLVAICSDPDKAYDIGWGLVHRDYTLDPEHNIYYGDYADEAWATVLEFELNDTFFESGHLMLKDENGVWHNAYKENQKIDKGANDA